MHFTKVIVATSFAASAVEAAPRGSAFNRWWARAAAAQSHSEREHLRYHEQRMEEDARHGLHRRMHNKTGSTTAAQHQGNTSNKLVQLPADGSIPPGCPTPSLEVSTTTIDVTVYVTEEPSTTLTPIPTEDCETTTSETVESTTDCETITLGDNTAATTLVASDFTTEPCETTTESEIPSTTPCETDYPTSSTPHYTVSLPPTPTTTPPATSINPTICIDTTIVPLTTSKLSITAPAPPEPTRTVCIEDHETGSPAEEVAYCGVNGKPAGVYFIAEFIEERSGVPVTEEGCYQFCDSVMESTDGCQSYRFYHNELGAPRCALYGMPVSKVVDDIDENQDDKWYDLACGPPSEQTCEAISIEDGPKTSQPSTTPEPSSPTSKSETPEPTAPSVDAGDVNSGADNSTATNSGNNNAGSIASGNNDSGNVDSSGNGSGNINSGLNNSTNTNSGNVNSGNTNSGNVNSDPVNIDIDNFPGQQS